MTSSATVMETKANAPILVSPQGNSKTDRRYTFEPIWKSGWMEPIRPISRGALLDIDVGKIIPYMHLQCQGSFGVTFRIERTLNELVALGVRLPQPGEVRDYVLHHPDLTDLLLPVCENTRQQFGARAQLSLEIYRDPEIEDEYVTLYLRQYEYDESVMKRIKMIRKEYEEMLIGKSGWFLLTTDFRPPR